MVPVPLRSIHASHLLPPMERNRPMGLERAPWVVPEDHRAPRAERFRGRETPSRLPDPHLRRLSRLDRIRHRPIEIAGLLANIMSYTRLAGLGIGKAAIASAFNTILFQGMIFPGQIGFVILGIVFLIMAHLLVFLLGWISAGIQALRLNYVEAFIKFYKGNGTPFRPFGKRTTQEV